MKKMESATLIWKSTHPKVFHLQLKYVGTHYNVRANYGNTLDYSPQYIV